MKVLPVNSYSNYASSTKNCKKSVGHGLSKEQNVNFKSVQGGLITGTITGIAATAGAILLLSNPIGWAVGAIGLGGLASGAYIGDKLTGPDDDFYG